MAIREKDRSQLTKLHTFKNILQQELDSDFDDSVVIGGVDAFIKKWKKELTSKLGALPRYSNLSKSKRKLWIFSVLKKIDGFDVSQNSANKDSINSKNKANRISKSSVKLTDSVYQIEGITRRNISE